VAFVPHDGDAGAFSFEQDEMVAVGRGFLLAPPRTDPGVRC
jgi:hypothetical protein